MEEWRPIPGFPDYQASTLGRVQGPRGIMQPCLSWNGFRQLLLRRSGVRKNFHLQTVIALAFLGPPPSPQHQLAFRDEDKTNCAAANLYYRLRSDARRAIGYKYSENARKRKLKINMSEMRNIHRQCSDPYEVAKRYGVSLGHARRVLRRAI